MEPLIGVGLVNLIPDPIEFDLQLFREMLDLARDRQSDVRSERDFQLYFKLAIQDLLNSIHPMPRDMKVRMLMAEFGLPEEQAAGTIDKLEANADKGNLTLLQPSVGSQLMQFRIGPNYEMALFIAQATGSVILTDSESKWIEMQSAQHRAQGIANYPWNGIYDALSVIPLDYESIDNLKKSYDREFARARQLLKSTDSLVRVDDRNITKITQLKQQATELVGLLTAGNIDTAEIKVLSPESGFYDRTVQRLLIRSGCPRYDDYVRSVYYVGIQL